MHAYVGHYYPKRARVNTWVITTVKEKALSVDKTCLDDTGLLIVREVYRACEMLGADPGLLAAIGSWGDTLDDVEDLKMLKSWNEMGEPFVPVRR